jgi:hypothetical protein
MIFKVKNIDTYIKRSLLCVLFCVAFNFAYAQNSLTEKLGWYAQSKSNASFFVHFDKNVYTNNETIFFTGYLIKGSRSNADQHKIMAATLIRDADSAIILTDKFLMEKGIGFGSVTLPDSILTGNYHVLVYTDRLINGNPEAVFAQSITLKTNIQPPLKANIKLSESEVTGQKNQVLISVTSKDDRFLIKPTKISYVYGNTKKIAKTDVSGQLLVELPPQANSLDPNLYMKLVNEKDSAFLSLTIPQKKRTAIVSFYPEGGNMVSGLPATIGWEVKDRQQMPIALKAHLFKNNNPIDTIETNSYGIGKFRIVPDTKSVYSIKLLHSGLADSIYLLPKALDKGVVMTVSNAIVQDTVNLIFKTNSHRRFTLLVHNYKEDFVNIPFDMEYNNKSIKIPLNDVPKGLLTITLLDSLDRPLAERLIFAHYDLDDKISISTDAKTYKPREKVTVKFKLNTDDQAVVSIAAVQDNRLELKKMNDIVSYSYILNELQNLPVNLKGNPMKDNGYLADVLLVKGWRRYTWQDLQKVTAKDTLLKTDSLQVTGLVTTRMKKKITVPINISALGDNETRFLTTSADGSFDFKNSQLIFEPGKKMYLFSYDKNKEPQVIEQFNSFIKMDRKLAGSISFQQNYLPSTLANNTDLVIKSNEKVTRLAEVKITAKKDESLTMYEGIAQEGFPGRNACGDYVCRMNLLNCPNHRLSSDNTQPVKGVKYANMYYPYKGCIIVTKDQKKYFELSGLHWEKEFYHDSYSNLQEPALLSTVYWNYAATLISGQDTEFSFYTTDITGKFRIVVQGISNRDVVYGEHFFEVIDKASGDKR